MKPTLLLLSSLLLLFVIPATTALRLFGVEIKDVPEEEADRIILEEEAKGFQRRSLFGITWFTGDSDKPSISEMKDKIKTASEMNEAMKSATRKASLKGEEEEESKDLKKRSSRKHWGILGIVLGVAMHLIGPLRRLWF